MVQRSSIFRHIVLALMSVLSLSASAAVVIFNQDFSSGGVPGDYLVGGTASGSKFDVIGDSSGSAGFTQSITDSALVMQADAGASGAQAFLINTERASQSALQVNIRYQLLTSGFGPRGSLYFDSSRTAFQPPVARNTYLHLSFRSQGSNAYQIESFRDNGNTLVSSQIAYGGFHEMQFYVNNSPFTVHYTGPDDEERALDQGSISLFLNTGSTWQPIWINELGRAALGGDAADLGQLRFQSTSESTTFNWDMISILNITPIPEPSTALLLLLGTTMVSIAFRNRRQRIRDGFVG